MPDDMKRSARLAALREALEVLTELEVAPHRPPSPGMPADAPPEVGPAAELGGEGGGGAVPPEGEPAGDEPLAEGDLEALKAKLAELCA
jgi:hypothetical protein